MGYPHENHDLIASDFRLADRIGPRLPLPAPKRCASRGCQERPSTRKPYCPVHIDRMAYVGEEVLPALEQQNQQDQEVLARGPAAVLEDSLTAQDMLRVLEEEGPVTLCYVAAEIDRDEEVVAVYVQAFVGRGVLRVGPTGLELATQFQGQAIIQVGRAKAREIA